jgi:hypothetical protein
MSLPIPHRLRRSTHMKAILVVAIIAIAGCKSRPPRAAHAVGTYLGGGSTLTGPSSCTYDAAPAVAELATDASGKKFMAKLVGEGTITETCGDTKTIYDVVTATAARIDGPATWKVGATASDHFSFAPLAGARVLEGVHQGGPSPDWSLGKDCEGVATFGEVLGAQDTGGADITRSLIGTKAGSCTITAALLGVTATKTVQLR